jgi:D-alanyl-D-alanine carboxypeptidase (penicillin-binding protein 5/6)
MKLKFRVNRYCVFFFLVALWGLSMLIPYVQLQRGLPDARVGPLTVDPSDDQANLDLAWPLKGNAAVSVGGVGIIATSRDNRPQPIASLTKVMTAYVVMKDHPLKLAEPGPKIRVEAEDVQLYRQQLNNGESVIPVVEGTEFSQYELLVGLLVPSGNNLAFLLARWSSGDVPAFVDRMNEEALALGLKNTRYADPSGLSPLSVSTAEDQIVLAEAMMSDPVLAAIVGLKQTQLPGTGVLYNVNALLGQDHLIGLKTGWTEEAGACFLFAADWPVEGKNVTIYGAVFGQDTLADAFAATRRLLVSVGPELRIVTVISQDGPSTPLSNAWGGRTTALPKHDARVTVWPGLEPSVTLEAPSTIASVKQGDEIGQIIVKAGAQQVAVPMISQGSLSSAGLVWRLKRAPAAPW